MMSEDAPETLFSFELLVDHIRLQTNHKAPDRLAVGLRFLDFPTLLIYQHPSERLSSHRRQPALNQRDFPFHRGKSCFFKMNPGSLRVRLSAAPLHAMVLDVTEETSPRFLGSSLLSLAEAMGRIKLLSSPSAHTGKGVVAVSGLSGEMIGTASLSYRLVCLGASLLPHMTEGSGYEGTTGPGGQEDQERSKEKNKPGSMCSPTGSESQCSLQGGDPGDPKIRLDESEEDDGAESQTEEDLTAFCPPHLYYSNTTPSHNGNTEQDCRSSNLLDAEGRTFEDSLCAGEEGKRKVSGFKAARREMTHATETSGSRETDVLRGALRRLPLLNALVAELSQLSVRPDPAHNTGPASSDHRDPRRAESLEEDPQLTDGHLYRLSPPRNCSTPLVDPAEVQHAPKETPSARKPQRKKLEYGTTKTYRLRLKQISPVKANSRECRALTTTDTRSRRTKETEKSRAGEVKSKKRGFLPNQRPNLDDNTGTKMQSDAALRGTVTLRPATQQGPQTELQGRPVKQGHHGASDQPDPQSDGYQPADPLPEPPERRSSRSSSPDSLFSQGSGTADDANYADDFDSLESSSTSSPNPDRSPELLGAKAPKSPISPRSSRSEGFQKKSGTHVIPLHARSSAHSNDEERPRSSQSVCSRKQADASGQTEQISSAESVLTSRSEKEKSPRSRSLVRGFPAESTSSVEELEDELGSLDFRKEYKHISELVASKLPGYTM
ncbi:microtubule-associated protein 10 [Fundulus heteroclitus]|uniref:microtubule-associated protein 10 n=1 Tax=Fundulus heteroclitus TaxID=8078 RepID=UPI00165BFDF8|nr:microtubule-associated protein 10 [Fundulus heteroclitus]